MIDVSEFGKRVRVRKRTADAFEYSLDNRPLTYLRIGLLIFSAMFTLVFMEAALAFPYFLLLVGLYSCFAMLVLLVNQDYAILVYGTKETITQAIRYWPTKLGSILRVKFSNVISIDVETRRDGQSDVYSVHIQTDFGRSLVVGKYIYKKDQANRLRAILMSYVVNDDSALSIEPFKPGKESDKIDITGRRAYAFGIMLLFASMLSTLLTFAWLPLISFIIPAALSGLSYVFCMRGVDAIEQKVASEMFNPDFSFQILRKKRMAQIMMVLMICGEFVIAASVQASMNAGPEVLAALYNSDVDNVFEWIGLVGMLVLFIGMFGFMGATADVVDSNLKMRSRLPA